MRDTLKESTELPRLADAHGKMFRRGYRKKRLGAAKSNTSSVAMFCFCILEMDRWNPSEKQIPAGWFAKCP